MNFFSTYRFPLILFLLISFGFFLRVYHLSTLPFGFFSDEAAVGYNAYSILTKGTDEYGSAFPLFFRSFNDYKTPIEIYSTVPSVALFGLTIFSVRIVSVLYGMASIIMLYFLTKELVKENKQKRIIALFATFFLVISPWHIHISRIGWESVTPFLLAVITGTYFFLRGKTKPYYFPLAVTVFSLGMYTYFPARVFIPLFFLTLLIIFPMHIPKKKLLLAISITFAGIFALPFIPAIHSGTFIARLNQVSIFSQPPTNEPIWQHIAINYLQHFSLDFLFFKGDIGMPGQHILRQSVQGMGELYFLQLPLILYGVFYLVTKQKRMAILFFVWLLLYPIGSMFTLNESPYATRSIIGVLPFSILSGIGLWYMLLFFKHMGKYFYICGIALFSGAMIISFMFFIHLYFQEYSLYSSGFWGWQYGAQPIVEYFTRQEKKYDALYMEGDIFNSPDIFLKFFSPHGCTKCFIGDPVHDNNTSLKQLFAVTPDYILAYKLAFRTQKTIYYPSGQKAFLIGTIDHL